MVGLATRRPVAFANGHEPRGSVTFIDSSDSEKKVAVECGSLFVSYQWRQGVDLFDGKYRPVQRHQTLYCRCGLAGNHTTLSQLDNHHNKGGNVEVPLKFRNF